MNHYFRDVVDSNRGRIVKEVVTNVECIGPHSLLLKTNPLQVWRYSSWYYLEEVFHQKQTILRVAEICQLTSKAKIEALYLLDHLCEDDEIWEFEEIDDDEMDNIWTEMFSHYSTVELQQMLVVVVRVVFNIAEIMNYEVRPCIKYPDYCHCSRLLLANGLDLLVQLSKRKHRPSRVKKYVSRLFNTRRDAPIIDDQITRELIERGDGLMRDPGIEIKQFFYQENTWVDIRLFDDEDQDESELEDEDEEEEEDEWIDANDV